MRRLLIIAALCSVLFARSPPVRPIPGRYRCQEDQDEAAAKEAELFINEQHRHGYKFKLSRLDSRTVVKQDHPCLLNLELTLEETNCHVVNPAPLEKCTPRDDQDIKVEAKCNVTICGGGDYPGIKRYTCNTEPESKESVLTVPDRPVLLPLDDEHALESVRDAVKKFNKDSNHTSYFKLLEVGRTLAFNNPATGMKFASEFAIVETACSDKATAEDNNCEKKCAHEADYGFCRSRNDVPLDLSVECTIYDNSTSRSHIPFFHGKRCERQNKGVRCPPGPQDRHRGAPEVSPPGRPGINPDVPYGCYIRLTHPYHPHHHGGHHHHHHHGGHHHGHGDPHHGGHHHGGPHDKKHKEDKEHPHGHGHGEGHGHGHGHGHGDGHGHGHGHGQGQGQGHGHGQGQGQGHGHGHGHSRDHKEPHPTPTGLPSDKPTRTECPGLAEIHPNIHPICSFPPTFWGRGHKLPQGSPAPDPQ